MSTETKTCPYCFEEIKAEAVKCRWCKTRLSSPFTSAAWARDLPGRRFLGVASVLAIKTGISVTVWRILFILLTLYHGLGLIVYFSIWILTPFRPEGKSLLDKIFDGFRRTSSNNCVGKN